MMVVPSWSTMYNDRKEKEVRALARWHFTGCWI